MTKGLSKEQRQFLKDLFPGNNSLFQTEEAYIFGTDASRLFAPPWAVVRPQSKEQVQGLLRWAQIEKIPIIPRARGTNVVGDCVPYSGGVVVSTLLLDRIILVDEENGLAVVEPGVVTASLQDRLRARGLFYPPDPASVKISTIGGNVSTNAGGLRAVKYGVTKDYILGIEAVLAGGERINTGSKCRKDVVGLDLTRLLIGSEGTLAFFTEIICKILPLPEISLSILVGFKTLEEAMSLCLQVFKTGILPVAMELMDEQVIKCLEDNTGSKDFQDAQALLLFQFDGSKAAVLDDYRQMNSLLHEMEPLFFEQGKSPSEEEELWDIRRMINPASFRLGSGKLSVDITVPRGIIKKAIEQIKEIGQEFSLSILTFGHVGDGNIHVNIMFDDGNEKDRLAAENALDKVLFRVIALEGTISGEHGVGVTKLPYFCHQIGNVETNVMKKIKDSFDPSGIMNPGKGY